MSYRVLTDLDSILDTRIGTLQLMLNKRNLKFDDVYGGTYFKRVLDDFSRPDLGITKESYQEAFDQRDIQTLVASRPTRLLKNIFNVIITSENLMGKPITIERIEIFINMFPYKLDDETKEVIREEISGKLGYHSEVFFIEKSYTSIDSRFVGSFDYVFMYHLLGKSHRTFVESIGTVAFPNTRLGIPKVFLTPPEEKNLTPGDQLMRLGVIWGVYFATIPIDLKFYDGFEE